VLEVELTKRNIPFVKYGGLKFLEAAHVKDMMSVLRWADNPRNSVAGFRVLKLVPGIGPGHAKQALDHFEAQGHNQEPGRLRRAAAGENGLEAILRAAREARRSGDSLAGQVGMVREWYKPQLERIYDAAFSRMGDLEQLEQLSGQHPSRERFLTELTLDPPTVTSDQSGSASKDEDYVILSTIHSAKGQEWDIVYVLNVADGNFPSEFSTGKPEMIEEERRLLYVAMTRARNELHLCAPLKYSVTQQAKNGDAHVYGAKSRFMTDKVLACFENHVPQPTRRGKPCATRIRRP
jgi:DNA helicase-2/ATP-dependent DNA helicase PcrA